MLLLNRLLLFAIVGAIFVLFLHPHAYNLGARFVFFPPKTTKQIPEGTRIRRFVIHLQKSSPRRRFFAGCRGHHPSCDYPNTKRFSSRSVQAMSPLVGEDSTCSVPTL